MHKYKEISMIKNYKWHNIIGFIIILIHSPFSFCQTVNTYNDLASLNNPGSINTIQLIATKIGGTFIYYPPNSTSSSHIPDLSQCTLNNNGNLNGIIIHSIHGGAWYRQFIYDENHPIQFDWLSNIQNGHDITDVLLDLAECFAPNLYVQMPSTPMQLGMKYIAWDQFNMQVINSSIKKFAFLESPHAQTTIYHKQYTANSSGISNNPYLSLNGPVDDFFALWWFHNYERVIIGGPMLNLSFHSNHPGLGIKGYSKSEKESIISKGLIEFKLDNNHLDADLVDFRANIHDTNAQGLNFTGGLLTSQPSTQGRLSELKLSGLMWNSSVRVHSGVSQAWYDVNGLKVSDPYQLQFGWDGSQIEKTDNNGLLIPNTLAHGCFDPDRTLSKTRMIWTQNVDKLSGGMTLEYGAPNANIFLTKTIGESANDPFVLRFKDIGISGPNNKGLPVGVSAKKPAKEYMMMKHDPLWENDPTIVFDRFIRIEQLPFDYGNYIHVNNVFKHNETSPGDFCALDNSIFLETDDTGQIIHNPNPSDLMGLSQSTGHPNIWRAEASRDSSSQNAGRYITAFVNVTFKDLTPWYGSPSDHMNITHPAGSGSDYNSIAAYPKYLADRSYGHVINADHNSIVPGLTSLLDKNTVTGPGLWQYVQIFSHKATDVNNTPPSHAPHNKQPEIFIDAKDNLIHDVKIADTVGIGVSLTLLSDPLSDSPKIQKAARNTILKNVEFVCDNVMNSEGHNSPVNLIADCQRNVMYIGDGSNVIACNINAPAGSMITGIDDNNPFTPPGSLLLNGINRTLPFEFGMDSDRDGHFDENDNCPDFYNPNQSSSDSCTDLSCSHNYITINGLTNDHLDQDGYILENPSQLGHGLITDEMHRFNQRSIRLGDDANNAQYRSILSFHLPPEVINAHSIKSARILLKQNSKIGQDDPFNWTHSGSFINNKGELINYTAHNTVNVDVKSDYFAPIFGMAGTPEIDPEDFNNPATVNHSSTLIEQDHDTASIELNTEGIIAIQNATNMIQLRLSFEFPNNNNNQSDYIQYFSSEATILSDRPQLLIEYYPQ